MATTNKILLDRLNKIDSKLDSIAIDLSKYAVNCAVLENKTETISEELVELKDFTIPEKIKLETQKIKIWAYASICSVLVTFVISLLLKFVF